MYFRTATVRSSTGKKKWNNDSSVRASSTVSAHMIPHPISRCHDNSVGTCAVLNIITIPAHNSSKLIFLQYGAVVLWAVSMLSVRRAARRQQRSTDFRGCRFPALNTHKKLHQDENRGATFDFPKRETQDYFTTATESGWSTLITQN